MSNALPAGLGVTTKDSILVNSSSLRTAPTDTHHVTAAGDGTMHLPGIIIHYSDDEHAVAIDKRS